MHLVSGQNPGSRCKLRINILIILIVTIHSYIGNMPPLSFQRFSFERNVDSFFGAHNHHNHHHHHHHHNHGVPPNINSMTPEQIYEYFVSYHCPLITIIL
jgi:G3E family GTPase